MSHKQTRTRYGEEEETRSGSGSRKAQPHQERHIRTPGRPLNPQVPGTGHLQTCTALLNTKSSELGQLSNAVDDATARVAWKRSQFLRYRKAIEGVSAALEHVRRGAPRLRAKTEIKYLENASAPTQVSTAACTGPCMPPLCAVYYPYLLPGSFSSWHPSSSRRSICPPVNTTLEGR